MDTAEVVRERQTARGISTAELARRPGIGYEALRVSLEGKRKISANELVALCMELELDISDFEPER